MRFFQGIYLRSKKYEAVRSTLARFRDDLLDLRGRHRLSASGTTGAGGTDASAEIGEGYDEQSVL